MRLQDYATFLFSRLLPANYNRSTGTFSFCSPKNAVYRRGFYEVKQKVFNKSGEKWSFVGKLFLHSHSDFNDPFLMAILFEVHECTIDAKGRILLPAPFKKQLAEVLDMGFVIKPSIFSKSLELYPMSSWDKISSHVNKLNRFIKKNVEFIRMFNFGVKSVELDSNGRFLIMKDLLLHAGIKKDVVIAGANDKLEIWDRKAYYKFIKDNTEAFETLTEDVMGGINPDDDGK
jgi:MraZ protein